MRHLIMIAALALSACHGVSLQSAGTTAVGVGAATADAAGVPPPSTAANLTNLDETLALGAEGLYKGFRAYAEGRVDAGKVKGAAAAKLAAIDRRVYGALGIARHAYDTGNADSYVEAVAQATAGISEGFTLIRGDGN